MRTFVGIDLGSTTTKAVLMDDNREVIGRGITNSRSNYATAARVASEEARMMNGSIVTVDGGAAVVDLPTLAFVEPVQAGARG